ncbi:MAG TPA: alpha/beta fold hydrolase, partial [Humisphaera sp.]
DERTGTLMKVAGWSIPARGDAPSRRTVVLVHGYADAKVGAIAWAPVWVGLGFNVLAIDLRAHGESGGRVCSGGYWERHDVAQVVSEWTARNPDATREVYLFGASMGAAVAIAAAELLTRPEADRPAAGDAATAAVMSPVAGVVLDSPFADFAAASAAHFELLGLPGGPVRRWALRLAGWTAQADFAAVRPVDLIPRVGCPVLVLAAGDDPYVTPAEAAAIERATVGRGDGSSYHRFDGVEHLMAVVADPDGYRGAIEGFVRGRSAVGPS